MAVRPVDPAARAGLDPDPDPALVRPGGGRRAGRARRPLPPLGSVRNYDPTAEHAEEEQRDRRASAFSAPSLRSPRSNSAAPLAVARPGMSGAIRVARGALGQY